MAVALRQLSCCRTCNRSRATGLYYTQSHYTDTEPTSLNRQQHAVDRWTGIHPSGEPRPRCLTSVI